MELEDRLDESFDTHWARHVGWEPVVVGKRLRVSVGIMLLVAVWLIFFYEAVVGDFLANGAAVILVASVGTYFGARLLGLKLPR